MRLFIFFLLFSVNTFGQQRPNIIYIMSDDHDADAISAYNKKLISTPNIDRIARQGILFTRCFVGNSICSPARATLLTGQHSHKNGVKDNFTRFFSRSRCQNFCSKAAIKLQSLVSGICNLIQQVLITGKFYRGKDCILNHVSSA